MMKEGKYQYNQDKAIADTTGKSPQLKVPRVSRVQSQDKMASSQPSPSDDKSENSRKSPPPPRSLDQKTPVIMLTLLHPQHSVAVQTWRFEPKSVIRIGRSRNNEVTLYSAVVSRHHVEIRRRGKDWEVVNIGSNGTFCQGKRISRARIENGMVIRLASSGPQLQIWTEAAPSHTSQAPTSRKNQEAEKVEGVISTGTNTGKLSREELEKAKQTEMDD